MKALLAVLLLSGCSTFDSDSLCTLFVSDKGVTRCAAWEITPSREQATRFGARQ